jgi:hypothetical protein
LSSSFEFISRQSEIKAVIERQNELTRDERMEINPGFAKSGPMTRR